MVGREAGRGHDHLGVEVDELGRNGAQRSHVQRAPITGRAARTPRSPTR
jgi:hypothetical protein